MKKTVRVISMLMVTIFAVSIVASCATSKIDVVGTWAGLGDDLRSHTIVFNDDGTYYMTVRNYYGGGSTTEYVGKGDYTIEQGRKRVKLYGYDNTFYQLKYIDTGDGIELHEVSDKFYVRKR